jgi:uncharacterized YigZ family protein
MSDLYRTVAYPAEAVFTEKRSKFLAFVYPIKSVDEAKEHVAALSKRYFDARHVCWAYMLGADRTEFRANDNGEPSGTAGKPILGQINSMELTDVVVAVVRYFGGIKLGTSGLIVAYRQAARMALEAAEVVERHVTADIAFSFPYPVMNDVMRLTKGEGIEMVESIFDNSCSMTLRVELDRVEALLARLDAIDGVSLKTDNFIIS